jgi:hypothetical protein
MNGKELRRDIKRLVERYGAEYVIRQVEIFESERAKTAIEKAKANESPDTRRCRRANRPV